MKPASPEQKPLETLGSAAEVDPASAPIDFLAPAQQPDELGRLGPYRILQVLGHGSMGVVFKAEDTRLDRICALKTMLPEVAKKPAMKERFLREACAAAKLEHDHIIPIYQVDEDRGVPYIAMPFLKGASLEDWFQQKQKGQTGTPLTEREILKLGREIAKGLAAAHDRGLVHRDIKPANIWLDATTGGRVKILDFGLARLSGNAGQQSLTQYGTILGTPSYMAPEQAQGEQLDGRADLFSLGIILYRLCTGELPFKGENPLAVLSALANREPPPVRERNPAISPALSELVMGLLVKDPAKRIASAKSVVQKMVAIERRLASGRKPAPAAVTRQGMDAARSPGMPMFERWLFRHDGRTHGPMPMTGVMRFVAAGRLLPDEPLWPEDFDPEMALAASATIDFAALTKLPATVPSPPRPAATPLPDWLSDVQQAETLNQHPPEASPPPPPDWLNDVQQVEQLIRRVKPVNFKERQREQQKQREQAAAASEPGETMYETFRRARNVLSAWADLDEVRPLLVRGNMSEVKQDPELRRIMQSYQSYGQELVHKLGDYLEFLVENRRKFYASRA